MKKFVFAALCAAQAPHPAYCAPAASSVPQRARSIGAYALFALPAASAGQTALAGISLAPLNPGNLSGMPPYGASDQALSAQAPSPALLFAAADVSLPPPAASGAFRYEGQEDAADSAEQAPGLLVAADSVRRELKGLSGELSALSPARRGVRLSAFYDNAQTFPGDFAPQVPSGGGLRRWWSGLLSRLGWARAEAKPLEELRRERMGYFLNARSIAVVGASPQSGKVGNAVLRNLQESYPGRIFPVNKRVAAGGRREMGLAWYSDLSSLPEIVDLVVIAVPAPQVRGVMEEVAKKGHRAVIVISAGIAESGHGEEEARIMRLAARQGIPVIGANSLGVSSPDQNASFGPTPLRGQVAFISQSGAMITGGEDLMRGERLGFRAVFSIGNKTDMDESDLIRMLGEDAGTRAIIGYLEDVKDGGKFLDAARAVAKRKPIVLLRTGRTRLGEMAGAAHTAALGGGTYGMFQAACEEAGVILVDSTRELFALARKLERGQEPARRRDAFKTASKVKPSELGNPAVDVVGDASAERYEKAISALREAPEVQAIAVVVTPQRVTEVEKTALAVVQASRQTGKLIVPVFFGGERMKQAMALFEQAGLRAFVYPEDALSYIKERGVDRGIGIVSNAGGLGVQMSDYAIEQGLSLAAYRPETISRLKGLLPAESNVHSFERVKASDSKTRRPTRTLDEDDAARILARGGLSYPPSAVGKDLRELLIQAKRLEYGSGKGLVLKAVSPDIDHMRKAGGIAEKDGQIWFIKSEAELQEAFPAVQENLRREDERRLREKLPRARITGYLLSQVVEGQEMIIGLERNEVFGLVLTLGAGGSDAEQKDDAVKIIFTGAMNREERMRILRERIAKLEIYSRLRAAGADIETVLETAIKVYAVGAGDPRIKTIDVNPIKIDADSEGRTTVMAVDAWMELFLGP